ncbi:MAG: hypothetical protein JRD68_13795 [Deltaproteobacteria bacterium]|nr:hypothetical protein [Deltaproteobacteria bacterium]
MAEWLPIIGIGLSAAGTIYSASKQAETAEFNAQLAEEAAQQERERAAREERRYRRQAEGFRSTQQSLYAVSGLRLDEGSPQDVIMDSAMELEMDALAIRAGAEARSLYYQRQAELERRRGSTVLITGAIKAGTSLLSDFSAYKWGE